jgi:geranyl diphosphate 2-C-methyltransferase
MNIDHAGTKSVIGNAYEAEVARYWDTKQDDAINLLLGEQDGLVHHHYGVGDFDRGILRLPAERRERALLRDLHRLENDQTRLIIEAFGTLGPESRLLDAGSGRGGTSFMLHDAFGCTVDGVTISRYQVDYSLRLAQQRGCADTVRFHFRNMLRTGFPDDTFDGVVTNETTMYVDLFDLYQEFARVLRPGGRYVAITWCINDAVGPTSPDIQRIEAHYGCHMHPKSRYIKALVSNDLVPCRVADLTAEATPYWELRSHSTHRTGIEDAFLTAYQTNAANFLLIGADLQPTRPPPTAAG